MEVADPSGRTAIFCVSTAGCLETVKMLLEGFSAEEKWRLISMQDDSGQTPLFNVAAEEYGDTMKTLLSDLTAEQQRKLIYLQDRNGQTLFHNACVKGISLKMVMSSLRGIVNNEILDKLLLIRDNKQRTALHIAAENQASELVLWCKDNLPSELLLKLLKLGDAGGQTLFHIVSTKGQAHLIASLLNDIDPHQRLELLSIQCKSRVLICNINT